MKGRWPFVNSNRDSLVGGWFTDPHKASFRFNGPMPILAAIDQYHPLVIPAVPFLPLLLSFSCEHFLLCHFSSYGSQLLGLECIKTSSSIFDDGWPSA